MTLDATKRPKTVREPDRASIPLVPPHPLISGCPENPQISVEHNHHPLRTRQPRGAYSIQLHSSHCNLCHVIIGFRCRLPFRASQVIWNIWCGRKMMNSLQCLLTSHTRKICDFSADAGSVVASFVNIWTRSSSLLWNIHPSDSKGAVWWTHIPLYPL